MAARRRMLIYLGIGTIVAFLLARLAMRGAENVIVGGIADGDVAGAARSMVDATLQDLRGLTAVILIATVVVVIAAYLWGRPKWVLATTSYVGDAAGRAGTTAGAAASAGATGVAGRAPDRDTLEQTVRENRTSVERIGLRVIVFVLVWVAVGFEIAVLGAALVVGYLLVLRAVAGPSDTDVADSAPPATDIDDTATTAIATPAAAKVTEAPAPPPKTTRPAKRKPPAK